jgi:acyl-CoA hydrolase
VVEARPVSDSAVVMTEMILPSHTNSLDSVFGGVIMSWIDICAAISALRHCNRPVVTASIDAVNFMAPAYKGWIVTLVSSVNYVSRTSMEVGVRVEAEHLVQNEKFQIASAYLTFVALDDNGKPMPVPKVIPQSVEEKRRYEAAKKRRELRLQTKK